MGLPRVRLCLVQNNVELVYRAFRRLQPGADLDAVLALTDEDIEAVPRVGLMEGSYHGHDGLRRWWEDLFGVYPDFAMEVVEVRDLGDLTLAALRFAATAPEAIFHWTTPSGA